MRTNSMYDRARQELALALWEAGTILTSQSVHPLVEGKRGTNGMERGFKLKLHEKNPDAPLSPLYLNLRTPENPKPGPLTPKIVDYAARCMMGIRISGRLATDAVVGVPRAGDPFAQAFERLSGLHRITLGKYEQGGIRCIASLTEQVPVRIRKVVLVDDLVTKADSKREAIQVLRDAGLEVSDVIVLVDHEQGGREELAKLGCNLHSVFTATELLDEYVETGKMGPHIRADIDAYRALQI